MRVVICILLLVTLLAFDIPALASDIPAEAGGCHYGATKCNAAEEFVLSQMDVDLPADMADICKTDTTKCLPISPNFLRALITNKISGHSLPSGGLRLSNALICRSKTAPDRCGPATPDPTATPDHRSNLQDFVVLDLSNVSVAQAVNLSHNLFRGNVNFDSARFVQDLNFDHARFDGDLDLCRLRLDRGLTMVGSMTGGNITADGLNATDSVTMTDSKVEGTLTMRNATVGGNLNLDGMRVPPSRPEDGQAEDPGPATAPPNGLDISNTKIDRQLYLTGSVVTAVTNLSGIQVGGSVWMEAGTKISYLIMERSRISGSLLIGSGQFSSVDLTAAQIDKELRLERDGKPTVWVAIERGETALTPADHPTWLILQNAKVDAIRDTVEAWPDCVILAGFTYERPPHNYSDQTTLPLPTPKSAFRWCTALPVSGHDTTEPQCDAFWLHPFSRSQWCDLRQAGVLSGKERSYAWWINWLERDPTRSAETYKRISTSLSASGQDLQADEILIASRLRERNLASWPMIILLLLEETLVGFGIGVVALWAAMFWVLSVVTLAALALHHRLIKLGEKYNTSCNRSFVWCWFASLLTLLPVVSPPQSIGNLLNTEVQLGVQSSTPLTGRWLYGAIGVSLFGLILGGFLLHGLERLTSL